MSTKYAVKVTTKRETFYLRDGIRSASSTPAGATTRYLDKAAQRATAGAAERYAKRWAWFAASGAGGFEVEIVEVG